MVANSLFFNLTSTSGHITLDNPVPAQELVLKWASVVFSTNALAVANPVIYLDVDWLDANQLHDNNPSGYRMPLITGVIGTQAVTSYNPNIAMTIHKAIPSYFPYRITDSDGATIPTSTVKSVHILFEYDYGIITG